MLVFEINLQLFGGRGGSSGRGGGGGGGNKSEFLDDGIVVDMDEFFHVMDNAAIDGRYYDERTAAIREIWNIFQKAIDKKSEYSQLPGPVTSTAQAIMHGLGINLPDYIYYTTTLDLNYVNIKVDLSKAKQRKEFIRIMSDYLQNKAGKGMYTYYKPTSDVMDANPKAVSSLTRKGEKAIMAQPDSFLKAVAMNRKASRDTNGRLSDAFYQKQQELYSRYQYSDQASLYEKKYGKKWY